MGDMSETTLLDLLGRRWHLGSPVTQVVVDRNGTSVAFRLRDGSIALAPVADAESALQRFHIAGDTGRATIAPRQHPQTPLQQLTLGNETVRIATFGTDFVAAGAGGRLWLLQRDGTAQELAALNAPVQGLLGGADGSALIAAGDRLKILLPGGGKPTDAAGFSGASGVMAITPDGHWLAQAAGGGLAIGTIGGSAADVARVADLVPLSLAWSADGRWLAAGLEREVALLRMEKGRVLRRVALPGYPAPVRSLAWNSTSDGLATGGAFRIIVWALDATGDAQPTNLPTGRGNLAAVARVAVHPGRPLVAAAFETGMIVIAPLGGREDLIVRPPRGDPVEDLAWTPDGQQLVFGTRAGEAAIVTFPPQMFK